jgi:hypothetical protein
VTERKHEKLEETVVSKNQIACVITRERETVVPVKVELKLPTGIKTIHDGLLAKASYCKISEPKIRVTGPGFELGTYPLGA